MATRADEAKAEMQRHNSEANRRAQERAETTVNKPALQRIAAEESPHGRALHASTKLRADAKAGKHTTSHVGEFWRTGPNGGEPQTVNGVPGDGRGADGPASIAKASRKSTRGGVPGGEKPSAQLTRQAIRETHSPEERASKSLAHGVHFVRSR